MSTSVLLRCRHRAANSVPPPRRHSWPSGNTPVSASSIVSNAVLRSVLAGSGRSRTSRITNDGSPLVRRNRSSSGSTRFGDTPPCGPRRRLAAKCMPPRSSPRESRCWSLPETTLPRPLVAAGPGSVPGLPRRIPVAWAAAASRHSSKKSASRRRGYLAPFLRQVRRPGGADQRRGVISSGPGNASGGSSSQGPSSGSPKTTSKPVRRNAAMFASASLEMSSSVCWWATRGWCFNHWASLDSGADGGRKQH